MNKLLIATLVATTTLGFSPASFATAETKATYQAAKDHAKAEYKIAHAKCDSLSGNPKDVCVKEAKAVRDRSDAEAHATYKGTLNAHTSAVKKIANADYEVAKEKCDALEGNAKDVCVKEAKSEKVAAKADAKAEKTVINALVGAQDDKMNAEYKVAVEKSGALTGDAKDSCVVNAKAAFGK